MWEKNHQSIETFFKNKVPQHTVSCLPSKGEYIQRSTTATSLLCLASPGPSSGTCYSHIWPQPTKTCNIFCYPSLSCLHYKTKQDTFSYLWHSNFSPSEDMKTHTEEINPFLHLKTIALISSHPYSTTLTIWTKFLEHHLSGGHIQKHTDKPPP